MILIRWVAPSNHVQWILLIIIFIGIFVSEYKLAMRKNIGLSLIIPILSLFDIFSNMLSLNYHNNFSKWLSYLITLSIPAIIIIIIFIVCRIRVHIKCEREKKSDVERMKKIDIGE